MEECSVCGECTAEYNCYHCDEFVCEDCTVAMTIYNQIDYTCCSNCRPDDTTHGQINKPKQITIMKNLETIKDISRYHIKIDELCESV